MTEIKNSHGDLSKQSQLTVVKFVSSNTFNIYIYPITTLNLCVLVVLSIFRFINSFCFAKLTLTISSCCAGKPIFNKT